MIKVIALLIILIFIAVSFFLQSKINHEIKSLISENPITNRGNPKIPLKSIKLENISKYPPRDDAKNIFFIDSSHVLDNVTDAIGTREACAFESAGIIFDIYVSFPNNNFTSS